MCGRYYTRRQKQEIAERLRVEKVFEEPFAPDYNIAPTTFQPIVRQERDSDDREMILARWGMVPFFAASLKDFKGFSTFNARAEAVMSSGTWRRPFELHRCLVPVDGFYEWSTTYPDSQITKSTKAVKGKALKRPFAISLKSGEPMALAGVWDAWREPHPAGKQSPQTVHTWLQSFAIITTEANEIMASIHDRMPVILAQRDWARWLNRDPEAPPPIDLLRPYDSDAMQTGACNPLVGNVKNNGPEMLITPLNSA